MKSILLKNIRAVDSDTDINCDILIDGGVIKKISGEIKDSADSEYDCTGLVVMPGLFDMHVHFRDPGYTYKEDIITGAASALTAALQALRVCLIPIPLQIMWKP